MRTRAKPASKGATAAAPDTAPKTITLHPSDTEPPRLVILPEDISSEARVVTLRDPATSISRRYLVCPQKGFHEFTRIAAPRGTPRSWLFAPSHTKEPKSEEAETVALPYWQAGGSGHIASGYLAKEPDLFVVTPVDPAFLLLPVLEPTRPGAKQMFLALDDHLDAWASASPHIKQLVRDDQVRRHIRGALSSICDVVDAGDEEMYRLSHEKLLRTLVQRAQKTSERGLPASMEEHFVADALKAPFVASIQSATSEPKESQDSTDSGYASGQADSQQPPPTQEATVSTHSDYRLTASEEVIRLQRTRTTLAFLLSTYTPPQTQSALRALLPTLKDTPDFAPLDAYNAQLDALKRKSTALRSMSDNISRKRSAAEDDDEEAEARAEKKRRKEEEEKRKKVESRGLKELKKVDVSGMKKLSSFFPKKPAVK